MAEADYLCCTRCLSFQLDAKVQELSAEGFVGFHEQDTDGCVFRAGELYLAFLGADESKDLRVPAVAYEVLRECGVEHTWSGDFDQKIRVVLPRRDWVLFQAAASYGEEAGSEEEEDVLVEQSEARGFTAALAQ